MEDILREIQALSQGAQDEPVCLGYLLERAETLAHAIESEIRRRHSSPEGCLIAGTEKCSRNALCKMERTRVARQTKESQPG